MILYYLTIAIALFFAMNIGASGTAATMGAAYGSGAVATRRMASALAAIAAFLGAILGGGEVVKTISGGIIPASLLQVEVVTIILVSATLTLFLANLLGIPLSTSEVTVGSIVGVGLAYQSLFAGKLLEIVLFWFLVPLFAFTIALVLGWIIRRAEQKWPGLSQNGNRWWWLKWLLIFAGMLEAFSAGMNNVANSVGPVIGADLLESSEGLWLGAVFMALGAFLLGGRVLETNGKKITQLSLLQGSAVSLTSGGLVIIASIFGIPVPLTQATTCAILGIGTAQNGFRLWQQQVIKQIIMVWIVSPVSSLVVSFLLINSLMTVNFYVVVAVASAFVATLGLGRLNRAIRHEKQAIHDQGGGI